MTSWWILVHKTFFFCLTGGPDGDVAGNEIKILLREYGANAKIVGISDVSGCAEDPNGLDHEEVSLNTKLSTKWPQRSNTLTGNTSLVSCFIWFEKV